MYNIQHTVTPANGSLQVKLECIRPDVQIRYTTDGTEPGVQSALYTKPLQLATAQTVKAATFANGEQMGKTLVLPVKWNKATAKPISGVNAEGLKLLVNGVRGSLKQTDFEWCSWMNNDTIAFTVDLRKKEDIHTVTLGCITVYGMAVHKPAYIQVAVSDDNRNFRSVGEIRHSPEEIFREGSYIDDCSLALDNVRARYVRITLHAGTCPDTHIRPGQEARPYLDELIIE